MPSSAPPGPSRQRLLLTAAGLLGIAGLTAVVLMILRLHDIALADIHRNNEALSVVLASQVDRSMQAVDLALHQIIDRIGAAGVRTPDDLVRFVGTDRDEQRRLSQALARIPQADAIIIVNDAGRPLVMTNAWPATPNDLRERDYFRHLRDQDDPNSFLSTPVMSKTDGQWTIYLARRLNAPNGSFLGIVMAAIRIAHLREIFSPLRLPQESSLLLLRTDGLVLVRHPDTDGYRGEHMPQQSKWYGRVAAGGGDYRSPGYFDQSVRQVAVHPVEGFPLVVDVSVSERAALAEWRRDAWMIGAVSMCMATALLLVFAIVVRQLRLQQVSKRILSERNAELKSSQIELAARSRELTTTLDCMAQGLAMVDADHRVVVCNRLAIEMLDLPPEMMSARPTIHEVFTHQVAQHEFDHEDESVGELIKAVTTADRTHTYERVRPGGRVIEIHNVPLDGGGFVRTFTDVTARKETEREMLYLAGHDSLTGLINRMAFSKQLAACLDAAAVSGARIGVLYLDLDEFKAVNDRCGHAAGDKLLMQAARRMTQAVRSSDWVARLGGDEFAVIATALDGRDDAQAMAVRLIEAIREPYIIDGGVVRIGVSIGVAIYPADGPDPASLVRNADAALYRVKRGGRDGFQLFAQALDLVG